MGDMKAGQRSAGAEKKTYGAPRILHTEKLEARAIVCAKADASCQDFGPIQS